MSSGVIITRFVGVEGGGEWGDNPWCTMPNKNCGNGCQCSSLPPISCRQNKNRKPGETSEYGADWIPVRA